MLCAGAGNLVVTRRQRFRFDSAARRLGRRHRLAFASNAIGQQRIVSSQTLGAPDLQLRFAGVRLGRREQAVTQAAGRVAAAAGQRPALGNGVLLDEDAHAVVVKDPAVASSFGASRPAAVVVLMGAVAAAMAPGRVSRSDSAFANSSASCG